MLVIAALQQIAHNTKARRLALNLTQQGLSERSAVPLATLRKFEQKGTISLESFLKIQMALGGLDSIVNATKTDPRHFSSIDEVLNSKKATTRKRGRQS